MNIPYKPRNLENQNWHNERIKQQYQPRENIRKYGQVGLLIVGVVHPND
jgi:hypothetical protein